MAKRKPYYQPRFRRRCVYCNKNATKQCDAVENNKTCVKCMCEKCAVSVGNNIDYCKEHFELRKDKTNV